MSANPPHASPGAADQPPRLPAPPVGLEVGGGEVVKFKLLSVSTC